MPEYIFTAIGKFPIYYICYFFSFPFCVLFNTLYYRKKYRMGNMRNVFFSMLYMNGVYVTLMLGSWIFNQISLHGFHYVRVVGFFPLWFIVVAKVSRSDYKTTLDFLTPANTIGNMVAHFGCIFPGCCYGYPIENYPSWMQWMGIYSNDRQAITFPIQLIECVVYGLIAVVIVLWAKSQNFRTGGKSYALYLILFGFTRFFMEFLRDNKKIAGPLSEFSFWCIGWFVIGTVWFVILYVKERNKRKILSSSVTYNGVVPIEGSVLNPKNNKKQK